MPFWKLGAPYRNSLHTNIFSKKGLMRSKDRREKFPYTYFVLSNLPHILPKRAVLSASMTLEAVFVLPMFVFFTVILIYVMNLIGFQNSVNEKMYDAVRTMSKMEYVSEGVSSTAMGALMVTGELGYENARDMWISGGTAGMMAIGSRFDDDMIRLVIRYIAKQPFSLVDVNNLYCSQHLSVRKWIGNEDKGDDANVSSGADDVLVFITETGTVYHRNRNCTHIKLSVSQVQAAQIGGLRNEDGGKYYACEKCVKGNGAGTCYITDTGDRFHIDRNCSGLKRTILAVPISAVGGKAPCSRCGK